MVTRVSPYSRLPASPHPAIAMASSSKDTVLSTRHVIWSQVLCPSIRGPSQGQCQCSLSQTGARAPAEEQLARRVWWCTQGEIGRILPFHDIWAPSGQHSAHGLSILPGIAQPSLQGPLYPKRCICMPWLETAQLKNGLFLVPDLIFKCASA